MELQVQLEYYRIPIEIIIFNRQCGLGYPSESGTLIKRVCFLRYRWSVKYHVPEAFSVGKIK